jgi:hypothetical protein
VSVGAFVTGVRNGKAFRVTMSGGVARTFGTFDSFERTIHTLAPTSEYRAAWG